ncbi:MAG: acetate--CoA ligase family protein [Desulfobacteraceae bacterium]|nr:acetate--CoA ligase family protein [Desulfobacteraceae bacterium]
MLRKEIEDILVASRDAGWVLEPEAKRLLALAGLKIPRFKWVQELEEGLRFAGEIGYPVVAKVVSSKILHKTDVGGVAVGVKSEKRLTEIFSRFSAFEGFEGMLVEETVFGVELIVGAKIDYQFGPVILMGIGGTGVEVYGDTELRMAPLTQRDVESMVKCLKAHRLLEGYRGSEPVDLQELTRMLITFSGLVMELEEMIESIDLNPVMCSSTQCVVADARIMLSKEITDAKENSSM